MIKNILFDMGNVLIHFDRKVFLDRLDISEADKQLLLREVFLSVEWVQMDRGTLREETAEPLMCKRLPEHLHSAVHELVSRWDKPMLPIAGMAELVEELKEKGYGIYLLSNASYRQHDYWPRGEASRFFDGTLISADEKVVKPQPEIYLLLCQKFRLRPEECFFIDDATLNVEAAFLCGMQSAVFHGDAAEIRRKLSEAGVRVRTDI